MIDRVLPMLKSCLLSLVLLASWLSASAAEPVEPPVVVVGFYDFPPAIYSDIHNQAQGPMSRLIEKMLRRAGYQAQFRPLPSARLYNALRDGSVHLWAGAPGKEVLAGHTLESDRVLTSTLLNLYYRWDHPKPRLPEDLAGSHIILISGYTYWPKTNKLLDDQQLNLRLHRTSSHTAALQMLERGRGDFLINYATPVNQAAHDLGLPPVPSVPLEELQIRYIISRHAPDAERLLQALDRVYDEMQAAGESFDLL